MFPSFLSTIPQVIQETPDEGRRELYRQWSALMMVMILLCVIVITGVAFLVARRRARRRMSELPRKKPGAPIADAWTEAGRRMDDSIIEIKDD